MLRQARPDVEGDRCWSKVRSRAKHRGAVYGDAVRGDGGAMAVARCKLEKGKGCGAFCDGAEHRVEALAG